MKTDPNESTTPIVGSLHAAGTGVGSWYYEHTKTGLTKREAFAMAAMQGLCGNPRIEFNCAILSEFAVKQADALIAALNKESEG